MPYIDITLSTRCLVWGVSRLFLAGKQFDKINVLKIHMAMENGLESDEVES